MSAFAAQTPAPEAVRPPPLPLPEPDVGLPGPPADLLRIADLSADGLRRLLDLASEMKASPRRWLDALRGETVACLFEKPSTRTRVSFAAAAQRLGMLPLGLRPDELHLGRGEQVADTARVLSSYVAAIVVRTYAQSTIDELAEAASVPVVNALSDDHHPCQALADLLTLQERFGGLEGLKVAWVGDGNNVAHSLLEACALAGMEIAVATPPARQPRADVVAVAEETGAHIALTDDPHAAVAGAHAVYTDVWVSMGDEEEREERLRELAPYAVDESLMALALPDAVFLHCLPAHRGEEVSAGVIDGPRSAVWQQAANRLPTQQALLYALVSGSWG